MPRPIWTALLQADAALRRVEKLGDLFARLLAMKQRLPRLGAAAIPG